MPVLLGALALLPLVGPARSDAAMRCGNDLVMEGMTKRGVISRCGEPDLQEVASVNTVGIRGRNAFHAFTKAVDVWQYNCGEGRFNRIPYFDGGRLARIENTKTYGSGPERCVRGRRR